MEKDVMNMPINYFHLNSTNYIRSYEHVLDFHHKFETGRIAWQQLKIIT